MLVYAYRKNTEIHITAVEHCARSLKATSNGRFRIRAPMNLSVVVHPGRVYKPDAAVRCSGFPRLTVATRRNCICWPKVPAILKSFANCRWPAKLSGRTHPRRADCGALPAPRRARTLDRRPRLLHVPETQDPQPAGEKMKTDATKKLPGEGFKRPWLPLISMDEAVMAKVEKLFNLQQPT